MITNKLEKLQQRRLDPLRKVNGLNEIYKRINDEPAIKYAVGAMQPIDPDYTRNTYKESERVQNQLTQPLRERRIEVEYDHQGSVTNDTHIKAHSDIDLLLVEQSSYTIEPPNKPIVVYQGDPVQDLRNLRNASARIISEKFPEVNVDTTGGRSVTLTGGSLARKIDLVFCNWWNTYDYVTTSQPYFRGIQVLDLDKNIRIANKPFLHNEEIDRKDRAVFGNLRKLIRLLKSLAYDEEAKGALSSYDVASVIFNMPNELMTPYSNGQELQLMLSCKSYLDALAKNDLYRATLEVPNKTRKVFGTDGASYGQLTVTKGLLDNLLVEIQQGLSKSFRKLNEARVIYT